jgi:glyoxylase-like metal-dependent hydrolase (beta-lactamase superfamily II)
MPDSALEKLLPKLPAGLHLLNVSQPRAGFGRFLSAWFFRNQWGQRILVDPGPASSIPQLCQALELLSDGVDVVLLTHVHIDHSGGVGQLCRRYPRAKVFAHPKGRKHLLEPARLWQSSLEVLGEAAVMQGQPIPVAPEVLLEQAPAGISVLETPGHAPHHLSFIMPFAQARLLFVGEAAGIHHPLPGLAAAVLRPATPPVFDGAAALASLQQLEDNLQEGDLLCYPHWGASAQAGEMIARARQQLHDWSDIISRAGDEPTGAIINRLLAKDRSLAAYSELDEHTQKRELVFMGNSVNGIQRFLRK